MRLCNDLSQLVLGQGGPLLAVGQRPELQTRDEWSFPPAAFASLAGAKLIRIMIQGARHVGNAQSSPPATTRPSRDRQYPRPDTGKSGASRNAGLYEQTHAACSASCGSM